MWLRNSIAAAMARAICALLVLALKAASVPGGPPSRRQDGVIVRGSGGWGEKTRFSNPSVLWQAYRGMKPLLIREAGSSVLRVWFGLG